MSNIWTAVKQLRTEKRFKNAPAPLDALGARIRQLSADLTMLRRALKEDKALVTCINNIIAHNSKLSADVDKVSRWCERLVGPFILYIECYTQGDRPQSLSSLLKAPFTFLPEMKELLVDLERFTSKDCGVSAITALLTVSRRMLALHTSPAACNEFEFDTVRSFNSGWGVSAAFNPLDIVDRALFDFSVDGSPEVVSEVLLLQTHGVKSLALCGVRQSGSRYLMYPPFKGHEFELTADSHRITLRQGERCISLASAPYNLEHWIPIMTDLFSACSSSDSSRAQSPQRASEEPQEDAADALGIAFGNVYDERNASEKFGDDFEEFEEPFVKTTVTSSQSLDALKRISVGMPMDFSDDLAKILRSIEEEDSELDTPALNAQIFPHLTLGSPDSESMAASSPPLPVCVGQGPRDELMAPSAPFARTGGNSNRNRNAGSPAGSGSPASFFTVGSQFPSPAHEPISTPPSSLDSPRTLDEAEELRRRISNRITARENDDVKARHRATPITNHTLNSATSLTSVMISDTGSRNCSTTALTKTDSLRDTPKSLEPNRRQPPNIPAPAPTYGVTGKAEQATVVRVSMPKRINFSADEETNAISSDLGAVPGSPLLPPKAPDAREPIIAHKFADSNPDLPVRRNSPAVHSPRLVVSMYSPDIGTPELPRSASDETNAQRRKPEQPLVAVPSAQPNIWFTEDPPKSSKVKAISKFFKKRPKTPKSGFDTAPNNNSSSTVATEDTIRASSKEATTNVRPAQAPAIPGPPVPAPARPSPPKEGGISVTDTQTYSRVPTAPQVASQPLKIETPAPTPTPAHAQISAQSPAQAPAEQKTAAVVPPVTIAKVPSTGPVSNSSSNTSFKSYSSSESDSSSKVSNRASTIFYRNEAKPTSRELFKLPTVKDTDPTAVCVESNNTTIASSNSSFKINSISSSLTASQSFASSLKSTGTISTANTSVGSTKAWAEFMNGVNSNVAHQKELRERREEQEREQALDRKAEELQKLEAEVQMKKKAIEEASKRVSELNSLTLDPGSEGKINRGVPIIRQLYEEKEKASEQAVPSSDISQLSIYRHPTQVSSAPILQQPGVPPLSIKKAGSVTFSEPSTPTTPADTAFSGLMWVSKWTVNRWVPLSQAELLVEIRISRETDIIVINMPGSSRPIKLPYSDNSDVRSSNAHDVEVRVDEDVYMFRCRSSHRCKKFHKAILALSLDPEDPQTFIRKAQDADSSSGSSGSSSSSCRHAGVPPRLAQTVNSKLRNVYPIMEE